MKGFSHALDHVVRRTGLWFGAASPVAGPTTCTPCDVVQNMSVLSPTHQNAQQPALPAANRICRIFLIPFFSKSPCNDVMQM